MGDTPNDAATLAVVVSRIDDLREDIAHMRHAVAEAASRSVSRGEWEQRNNYSDSRFAALGREIGDLRNETHTRQAELRAEVQSRRAPWWSVAAVLVSGLALTWTIVGPAITP